MNHDCDVLIAGGGPTGLTLAIELARRNIGVRLIDSAIEPFRGSRGKGIQPRTLEIFDMMGVISPFLEAGALYPFLYIHLGPFSFRAGSLGTHHSPSMDRPYPNLLMVPQWRTEEILSAHLLTLGCEAERGLGFTSMSQDDDGVSVLLSNGEFVRTRYLIGCDGGRSAVRKALGLALHGTEIDKKTMIVADLQITDLDRNFWHVWPLNRAGSVTLCPLPNTNLFQLQAPASVDKNGVEAAVHQTTGQRVNHVTWQSTFKHQSRMVDRYRVGRVLLAGDAAHIHPPSGGQGLNTGVQDSWNLGWKLASVIGGASPSLLDSYEQERLSVAAGVLDLTKELHVAKSRKRGELTNQLSHSYRDSVLSTGLPSDEMHPGDRMPDKILPDGRRLFDALRSNNATQFARRNGTQVLVRPDGYIGSIGKAKVDRFAGVAVAHADYD